MPFTLQLGDCHSLLKALPSRSVDLVLADWPYGKTSAGWDYLLDLKAVWKELWRVLTPTGVVALTGSQPFTSLLVASQANRFKHHWVWKKEKGVGLQVAKYRPMMEHEDVVVFFRKPGAYTPQMVARAKPEKKGHAGSASTTCPLANYRPAPAGVYTHRYPTSILAFPRDKLKLHPTQKPVLLMRYLIRTYTQPGQVVLDNTMGVGSTGVAAVLEGRRFIGMELDPTYYGLAEARLTAAVVAMYHKGRYGSQRIGSPTGEAVH